MIKGYAGGRPENPVCHPVDKPALNEKQMVCCFEQVLLAEIDENAIFMLIFIRVFLHLSVKISEKYALKHFFNKLVTKLTVKNKKNEKVR